MQRTRVLKTSADDPFETLALEEALLDTLRPDEIILLLYRHRPSVIVGRNQNVWAECACSTAAAEGIGVARRISGGGAVYHDENNLNFSFIVPRADYDQQRQTSVICSALHTLGIDAQFSGRNDLVADGRKFSGSAFCIRQHAAFHHGTILVGTDIERMQRYLQVSQAKMQANGVASVRSRVVNLRELAGTLTTDAVSDALIASFSDVYGPPDELILRSETVDLASSLAARNASWDWVYGRTPRFEIQFGRRFAWGSVEIQLRLERGVVTQAVVFSDAMDTAYIEQLPKALEGTRFEACELAQSVAELAGPARSSPLVEDVCALLADHIPAAPRRLDVSSIGGNRRR